MASTKAVVYDLRVKDRFGDHGLVGTAVVRKEDAIWRIDSLLMSCRVMGLGIETAFLERICTDASQADVRTIVGEFLPTSKNHPVKEFYAQHGFVRTKEEDSCQEWELDLVRSTIKRPEWITVLDEKVG